MYSSMIYLLSSFLFYIMLILLMMIGMAFLTLFERKLLGYIQDRKGPNKVGFFGLLQPFSDAIKLLNKEFFYIDKINLYIYLYGAIFILFLSLSVWYIYPFISNGESNQKFSFLYLMSLFSLGVYPLMMGGWASNSTYSMLGAIRSIAQAVSYEVSLFLMMFVLIMLIESYSLTEVMKFQVYFKFILIVLPFYMLFLVSLLIELNRTPFDLVEGESELVSGFNTEYFSSMFTLIFMAEYLSIVFMSFFITFLYLGFNICGFIFMMIWLFHMLVILWIRGVLPRIRYDDLMYLCWKKILSCVLIYMFFIYGVKLFIQMYI
uniref:NADH-ubiquinone oxidoreductase chain 1 n=1 Tax=Andrena chekiangensis TaxID=2572772 RepID=A0A4D6SRZ6_9HYME|nr:NADH dehydrogenase subunit 1 [Andrena chekiangensis]QCG69822.1 NADH dehydrogenase subunit 1 [Andrena chekiangensis]